jgi:hypothetical protein
VEDEADHLRRLYKQSVEQSGVCIVPELKAHHRAANFAAENPIKILAGLAVPSVAWIFYGRTGKEHLDFSVKLLHTRVFGQFATLSMLIGVMGFKEYMDRNGKYISQDEADARVYEMERVRRSLQMTLEAERQHAEEVKREIAAAHEQDVQERHQRQHGKKIHHKDKKEEAGQEAQLVNSLHQH